MDLSIDSHELDGLAKSLAAAPAKVTTGLPAVMRDSALRVQQGMRRDFSGHPRSRHFPASITFDEAAVRDGAVAEIGPDKNRKQGALGNILAFGTSKTAPIADITASARREEPVLVDRLAALGVKSLG